MTIIGTFDPSSETRPAISYPSSPNILPNSSVETAIASDSTTGAAGHAWSTTSPRSGNRAVRVTITTGFQFWRYRLNFPAPISRAVPLVLSGYVKASAGLVGLRLRLYPEISTGSGEIVLDGTWQRITVALPVTGTAFTGLNVGTNVADGLYWPNLNTGAYTGEWLDLDDFMVESGLSASIWAPQTSEPLYTAGQSWVSTGTGTLEGVSLTPGDLVTTSIAAGEYKTSAQADWQVTEFLTDPGDALQQKPIGLQGHEIGLGDWRICVQMLLPADPRARWGIARWGEEIWSGIAWYDITDYVRGATWSRGASSFGERPEVGTCELTLANRDYQFSPWNGVTAFQQATFVTADGVVLPGYLGPGTLVRVVAYSPSGQTHPVTDPSSLTPDSIHSWVPQFSGIVESWTDATVERGADAYVTVALKETISSLARVDVNAGSLVGAGDLPEARVTRLLEAAGWKYGALRDEFVYQLSPSSHYQLQSTDMAANRISELYLTADSVGGVIRSDRSGAPVLYNSYPNYQYVGIARGPEAGPLELGPLFAIVPPFDDLVLPYVADSLDVANDDEAIQNVVRLAFAGGTERDGSSPASIAQYGEVAYDRTDLICQSTDLLDFLISTRLAARALRPLRLAALALHSHHEGSLAAIVGLDVDNIVDVEIAPGIAGYRSVVTAASVQGYRHDLTPIRGGRPVWTVALETGLQGDLTMEEI